MAETVPGTPAADEALIWIVIRLFRSSRLGETLLLQTLCFRLMATFDEGVFFWSLLLWLPLPWYV